MPTWIWLLSGYYMDIWINRMHNSKLKPNYMRIDLLYGFYLVIMYFFVNYMSFNLLYEFYSMVMDFFIHASCKNYYLKYLCVGLFSFLSAH